MALHLAPGEERSALSTLRRYSKAHLFQGGFQLPCCYEDFVAMHALNIIINRCVRDCMQILFMCIFYIYKQCMIRPILSDILTCRYGYKDSCDDMWTYGTACWLCRGCCRQGRCRPALWLQLIHDQPIWLIPMG